jgi:hypothetical protein
MEITCCCYAALLILFKAHTLRVRHTMHGDTSLPPYLPLVFALMFHRSFRPSTPSWQSELYLKLARVCTCPAVSLNCSCDTPSATKRARDTLREEPNNRSSTVFQNREGKRALCSNFVLWWQAFFREAASKQSRVISSSRKAFFREAASQQSRVISSTRKAFFREAASQRSRIISSTRKTFLREAASLHPRVISPTRGCAHHRVLYCTSVPLPGR